MHPIVVPWLNQSPRLHRRLHQAGLSLLEVAMLMMILTLALAPLISHIGGPNSAQGNSARMVGMQTKEVLLANTLIEQALSNDYSSLNCSSTFDPASFPAIGSYTSYPVSSRCVNNSYSQPLYYQWVVNNASQANSLIPQGNQYYNAVLNIYSASSGGSPILTMPTSFFYNSSGTSTPQNKTGIVIIQDISGSMVWGQTDYGNINAAGDDTPKNAIVASPYLTYRYADPNVGYTPPANIALPWASGSNANNDQLDIVSAQNTDDPTTPWNDIYLGNGALGLGIGPGFISNCSDNYSGNSNWNSINWKGSGLYTKLYPYNNNALRDTLVNICTRSPNWDTMMNQNMSRIEAARGSLLNFILSVEEDSALYQNVKLGFETFSAPNNASNNDPSGQGYDIRVALESVDANNRYANMRRQVSWINREGPGQINAYEGTNYTAPINKAAQTLFSDATLNNRIILLVSDGEPNGPGDTHGQLSALSTKIGDGTYPGSNGQKASIFTLGLLSSTPDMPIYLQNDLAMHTPGGQYFEAQNVGDIGGIFDQIKYQLLRVILLNKSNRYNINFT